MKISRELAIIILEYLSKNHDFYFPFLVVCQEYTSEDDDFVEIMPEEWEDIKNSESYQTFELWENLQNLYENTTELLSKGFLDEILEGKKMKKYIFLTSEGTTQEPNGDEIENIQMLGISNGNNSNEAFQNLKIEYEWILQTSFNEIYCHELKAHSSEYFYLQK